MFQKVLLSSLSLIATVAMLACTQHTDADSSVEGAEAAITTGNASGFAECTGPGWSAGAADWKGIQGYYVRVGQPASHGDFSTITIFDEPNEVNKGAPAYLRTIDNLPETGRIGLGTDSAAGTGIVFLDALLERAKDVHWVLAQQKTTTGKIVGICLGKASNVDGSPATESRPYMLKRVGF